MALEQQTNEFCRHWQAHGRPLRAAAMLLHNRFLIVAVDETHGSASGCSIDGLMQFLHQLGRQYDVDFFNRRLIAVEQDGAVVVFPWQELRRRLAEGALPADVRVFNTWISRWEEFAAHFLTPLNQTPLFGQLAAPIGA